MIFDNGWNDSYIKANQREFELLNANFLCSTYRNVRWRCECGVLLRDICTKQMVDWLNYIYFFIHVLHLK